MEKIIVPIVILFIVLISIQYSLNRIIVLLKDIKRILLNQHYDDDLQ
ncbi:hypothetical protein [Alkaliphilus serpentinus]|nr:hypothetical protein [Alkaliphilus serpentinus]